MPVNISKPDEIVEYANKDILTPKQQTQIVSAFKFEAFDMGAEYAWRRAMTTLKESIANLGMKFIGEMLERDDINEFTSPDVALTDYAAIRLAEQLGIIGKTAALKLRQDQELLNHFFSNSSEEEMKFISALDIVQDCVQYILGEKQISVAIEFSNFRNRLQSETLMVDDEQLKILLDSGLFYIRTVLNVLLASSKNLKGAMLEHILANLNLILPLAWEKLAEKDKWNVGMAYRDVVAEGNSISAAGVKKALLKVKGFDFVPESLRSNTFKTAAKVVIDTHFGFNNFYNEPSVVSGLAHLGSVIPAPALQDCMDAYLLVYLGNRYGSSNEGAPIAKKELQGISHERWQYFFDHIIWKDELLLNNLFAERQVNRFADLLEEITKDHPIQNIMQPESNKLYKAIMDKDYRSVNKILGVLLDNI